MIVCKSTYLHVKSQTEYVPQRFGSMKHPDTGKWITCIVYLKRNPTGVDNDDQPFVRTPQSFSADFVLVEEFRA